MSVGNLLKTSDCPPLVFSNVICNWSSSEWNPEYLSNQLKGQKFKCKLAPQDNKANLWESECLHVDISIREFVEWLKGECKGDNPLADYKKEEISCYIDYKYMKDMFQSKPDLLKEVDWSVFGLDERDGHESTIWIGSAGCYTNCHYDTYGFNLIAQIYGRKKWTIFPPWCTPHLYPTRIPYEESSVFSQVNMKNPDLKKHPQFKHCQPYIVILEPGQVLYLPKHWWHFVECLEPSISINTWVDMDDDKESRIEEAVTRLLFSTFLDIKEELGDLDSAQKWVNPGEEIMDKETNIDYLQTALKITTDDQCKNESVIISNNDKVLQSSSRTVKAPNNFEKFVKFCDNLHYIVKTKTCAFCFKLCCQDNNLEILPLDIKGTQEMIDFGDDDNFDKETKRRKIDVCGDPNVRQIYKNCPKNARVFSLSSIKFKEYMHSLASTNTLKKFDMDTCASSSQIFCKCGISKENSKLEINFSKENAQEETNSLQSIRSQTISKICSEHEKQEENDVNTVFLDQDHTQTGLSPLGQSSGHTNVLDKFVRCLLNPKVVKTIVELMKEDNG